MSTASLDKIIEQIETDITYHSECVKQHMANTPDWSFHLGWVDALNSYRWKLKEILTNQTVKGE